MANSGTMKSIHRIALVMLLMLSLPAQSLALALSECEQQHQPQTPTSAQAPSNVEPDCHGSHATQDPSLDSVSSHDASSVSDDYSFSKHAGAICFHCSGACQQSKPLSLNAGLAQAFEIREKSFSPTIEATLAGIPTEVSRPPCTLS